MVSSMVPFFLAVLWLQPAAPESADLVLRGGKVISVDARDTIASAVAVKGNRILAVGSVEEISRWIGPGTEVVELSGRALLPGFIDAHTHIDGTAENEHFRVQIQAPPLSGPEEILAKLEARAKELPKGSWIVGQGRTPSPCRSARISTAPSPITPSYSAGALTIS
jgi:predicted amidohydrolase YtcJ